MPLARRTFRRGRRWGRRRHTADLLIIPVADRKDNIVNEAVVAGWKKEFHPFAPLYQDLLTEEGQMTRCDVIT